MDTSPTAKPIPEPPPLLLDVNAVAERLLACSTRHVYRLADSSRMPPPLKVGGIPGAAGRA